MKTDDLIEALVEDRSSRLPRPRALLAGALILGALVAGLVFLLDIGVRADIAEAAQTYRFLFKFVVTLTLAATAIGLALQILKPETRLGHRLWLIALAPALLIAAVIAELFVMPSSTWTARLVGSNARFCLTTIPLLSVAPLIAFFFALRNAAPADPGLAGAIAGAGSGAIAATLYASHCIDDSPLFVVTWYSLAIGLVTLAGYVAGRRLLRW